MNDEDRLKWVGYACDSCGAGVQHHGDWDVFCPECGEMIVLKNAIKLGEVKSFSDNAETRQQKIIERY